MTQRPIEFRPHGSTVHAVLHPDRRHHPNDNEGIGKIEALKHDFAGYWSRRITDEHRLVYKTVGDEIRVAACRSHYGR